MTIILLHKATMVVILAKLIRCGMDIITELLLLNAVVPAYRLKTSGGVEVATF
jgi:hypothetical protein